MKKDLLAIFLLGSCILGCSSEMPIKAGDLPLKYPVVLVHGIAAHDRPGGSVDFWGRIPEVLSDRGVLVFFGNTDGWGSYESNALILKQTIEDILRETNQEKVHIIAHSKGGIDSRYLIWRYGFGDKIASLTTISTPHHGAEIADLIAAQDIIYGKPVNHTVKRIENVYGDKNPNMYTVLYQLTTENMRLFNTIVPRDERVYYQSLYTVMESPLDDLLYFYSYLYIKKISGPNDGLVSEKSATWGNHTRKLVQGRISHQEITDLKKKTISHIDIPSLYVAIVQDLIDKGF